MIDLYLKVPTEEELYQLLELAGVTEYSASIDHIGSFAKVIGEEEDGTPILKKYNDYHCNLRGSFTEEQLAIFSPFSIEPPETPYRVWG